MSHSTHESEPKKKSIFNSLTIAALGVVFGDIGTSPLYAVREAFHGEHGIALTPENIYGLLSLILWSMILVISVKYLAFVMKADNKGEGGVLALTALAFPQRIVRRKKWMQGFLYLGLFGAALLVGDGIITPAISVLSSIEGMSIATPFFTPYVVPITLIILAFLFMGQSLGTARIGAVFGVVVLFWFLILGVLGLNGILQHPAVLGAFNPLQALHFFTHNGLHGIIVLGAVFLVVTGGEALYADMGHFGKKPIERAWFAVVLPGLTLNYFGQGALLLSNPEAINNPFFNMAPSWSLYPLVMISAMATVIASQAVISGVFSLTRQAVQLGYAPRFRIVHTSDEEIGQIYIPKVNWALFIMTCWLVLEFKTSSALASAYGIAVSTTMTITTLLTCSVAMMRWKWNWYKTSFVFLFLISIDLLFLGANLTKVADGGWFPLTVAAVVFTLMTTWRRGREILRARLKENAVPFTEFLETMATTTVARVSGAAVFMTGDADSTPPALLHNVRHNRVLHKKNLLMTVLTKDDPVVQSDERVEVTALGENFYRVVARYGFTETPDINEIVSACRHQGLQLEFEEMTFFLGRETLIATSRPGMAIWREKLFAFMSRNAERATAYYNIPPQQVVEIGLQIEL